MLSALRAAAITRTTPAFRIPASSDHRVPLLLQSSLSRLIRPKQLLAAQRSLGYTAAQRVIMGKDHTNESSGAEAQRKAQEERRWNRLADHMSFFHNRFKQDFNDLYEMADGSFSKRGLPLRGYLRLAHSLNSHLTTHHDIEEHYFFPILAKRMPMFAKAQDGEHIKSHRAIHKGLDDMAVLIKKWTDEPSTYSPEEMRACLDSWREVLFRHLDEEVEDLGAENMKKYWKLEEVDKIGI